MGRFRWGTSRPAFAVSCGTQRRTMRLGERSTQANRAISCRDHVTKQSLTRCRRRKCKWGRHCCRPHSHQRVVFSSGEPSKKRLAPDVSSSNGLEACRHRRSHRHPVPPFDRASRSWPKPFPVLLAFRRYRDHSPFGGSLSQSGLRLRVVPHSIGNQVPGRTGGSAIAFPSINRTCIRLSLSACPVSGTAWTITTASDV